MIRRRQLEARLALIADGAQSPARSALGIDHQQVDYGQSAVISNVEVDKPQVDTAYERFTEQGPLAMLPLGGRSVCLRVDHETRACGRRLPASTMSGLRGCCRIVSVFDWG